MPEARLMGGGIIVIVIVAFEGECVIQLSPNMENTLCDWARQSLLGVEEGCNDY